MSDDRQTLPSGAVNQDDRTRQAEAQDDEIVVPTEDEVVEDLKRQLAEYEERDRKLDEERRRERSELVEARRRAVEAETRAGTAENRARTEAEAGRHAIEDAQLESVNSAISARAREMDALKAAYAEAFNGGDAPKMADVQAKMAEIGGELAQLKAGKQAIEARKQTRDDTGRQTPSQPSVEDQRETFIRSLPPRSQQWVREHYEQYFNNPVFQKRVARYADEAVDDEGYARDSEEYIDHINQRLGLTQSGSSAPPNGARRGREADGEPQPQPQPRQSQQPQSRQDRRLTAAPAGGSVSGAGGGPNTGGSASNEVYLTAREKEIATSMGVTFGEYAKHKRDLQREGLIGPNARSR